MNKLTIIKSPINILLLIMVLVCLLFILFSHPTTGIYKTRTRMLAYQSNSDGKKLQHLLRSASTPSRTVILTILDKSWGSPGSVLDLFLESFRIGQGTKDLLNNLVIVGLDFQVFRYCQFIHIHCFHLKATGIRYANQIKKRKLSKPFDRLDYHTFNKRRIQVLLDVIQLGYNVVYTDADVMWLRNPFPHLVTESEITIGCDSQASNRSNTNKYPSGGFFLLKADDVSIDFLLLWKVFRVLYPSIGNQFLCDRVMDKEFAEAVGLRINFIETRYYGGFCQPSKDMSEIYTMHANCCDDLNSKVHDLKLVLHDSRKKAILTNSSLGSLSFSGSTPMKCLET